MSTIHITKSITIEKNGQRITLEGAELEQLIQQAIGSVGYKALQQPVPAPVIQQPRPAIQQQPAPPVAKPQVPTPAVKAKGRGRKAGGKTASGSSDKVHISDEKKQAIMAHINSRLSNIPQTLSFLLEGMSYVPNYLPYIRNMLEAQQNVGKVMSGKRVLYFAKGQPQEQQQQPPQQPSYAETATTTPTQEAITTEQQQGFESQQPQENQGMEMATTSATIS